MEMYTFEEFCEKYDPSPPDWYEEMYKDGLCRQVILTNKDAILTPEEQEELKKRKDAFYSRESFNILFKISPFKNP